MAHSLIPPLGFGLFRLSAEEVERVVPAALDAGFRHFDTAQIYGNEDALGRALQKAGVARNEIFLTTKVWITNYAPDLFRPSVEESLARLRVDQVDLLLLHWPGRDVPLEAQIEMLETVHDGGMTRMIGVSNQNRDWLARSVALTGGKIVTNQIEMHPYLDQNAMAAHAASLGVSLTAYFALADGMVPKDPILQEIGANHGKTAAQVALRWLLQQGHKVLTKTARPERVAENLAVNDFTLSPDEMARISDLARPDGRLIKRPDLTPGRDV